ncbi:MAG TPA: urocanate hydratase [Terriglobia bacterium]|nr:urocanate hydratase [Terriglobia bacterium]
MEEPPVKSSLQPASGSGPAGLARAPVGAELQTKGWHQEAALRMLMNSLDPAVAGEESPRAQDAAQPRRSFDALVESLRSLNNDETQLVRAGKPAGVFHTGPIAPRVLITNVSPPDEVLPEGGAIERLGSVLFGQTSATSWTSIGAQAALSATYMTFAAAAEKHFGGDLAGKLIVSDGMGKLGKAQPLAATMNGAAFLGIEANEEKITRSIRAGYCDYCVNSLDEALRILKVAVRKKQAVSVGLAGNCAEVLPELARRGVLPDLLTDEIRANTYIPEELTPAESIRLQQENSADYLARAHASIARHVTAMLELQRMGAVAFDFGGSLLPAALEHGRVKSALQIPHFIAAYVLPLLQADRAPLRWAALSGDGSDIRKIDAELISLFAHDPILQRWIEQAGKHVKFQGLPARAAWLGREQRIALGDRINQMVAEKEIKAPVVIAGDFSDSNAIARRPPLSGLVSAASGASWVAIQDENKDKTRTVTYAAVADGTPEAAGRIGEALANGFATCTLLENTS